MKYCKDCSYFREPNNCGIAVPKDPELPKCWHPQATLSEDMVYGTIYRDTCKNMRLTKCGIEANNFDAKY